MYIDAIELECEGKFCAGLFFRIGIITVFCFGSKGLHDAEFRIFSENVIIAEPAAVPTAVSDKGEYLGFCYIFAPAESLYMLPAFDIAFFDSEGNDSYMASPVEANTIGIQANVRTNISGIRLITRI